MLTSEYLKNWIKATLVRCIRTFAITFVGLMPAKATLNEIDWCIVISSCLFSTITCFMTCVVGLPELGDNIKENTEIMNKKEPEEYEETEEI